MRRLPPLAFLAGAAVLGVLALPAVHWRLIGCAKGEPFYQGRPVSYWRAEVAACEAREKVRMFGWKTSDDVMWVRRIGPVGKVAAWLADRLGVQPSRLAGRLDQPLPLTSCDPSAVPVLAALLSAPEPGVRFYAAQRLRELGRDALPAVPGLRRLTGDRTEVLPDFPVADAAIEALRRIDPTAEQTPGRP